MPTREATRSVSIGLGGVTRRTVGRPSWSYNSGVISPGVVTLCARWPNVLGIVDPPAFYIPAYSGHPDVGLTNPSALTLYTGSNPVPAGTYTDKEFSGSYQLTDSSTFDNCWFHGSPWYAVLLNGSKQYFNDCEFGKVGQDCSRLIGLSGGTFEAIRCNFHDAEDGAKLGSNTVMRMCHVHDLYTSVPGAHYDSIQAEEGLSTLLIEYCHLSSITRTGGLGNSAFFIMADFGDQSGVTGHNNYLNGGNYTLYLNNTASYNVTGSIITDNIFGPDYRYGLRSVHSGTVATWSGNVDHLGNPVPQ